MPPAADNGRFQVIKDGPGIVIAGQAPAVSKKIILEESQDDSDKRLTAVHFGGINKLKRVKRGKKACHIT
jgi:hypothetical protein